MSSSVLGQGQTTVGLTATRLSLTSLPCFRVKLVADDGTEAGNTNTHVVWVGDKNVSVGSGIPLRPGNSVELLTTNITSLFAITTIATQKLSWLAEG